MQPEPNYHTIMCLDLISEGQTDYKPANCEKVPA